MDPATGWWEADAGYCYCVYWDRCGSELSFGTPFFAESSVEIHQADHLGPWCVRDAEERIWYWSEIVCVESFRRLLREPLLLWRDRVRRKNADVIGRHLSLKQQRRLHLCSAFERPQCETAMALGILSALSVKWHRVIRLYSRDTQLLYDPAYADTISYLPLDTLILASPPPGGMDAVGWMWAKFWVPGSTHGDFGWIHPGLTSE